MVDNEGLSMLIDISEGGQLSTWMDNGWFIMEKPVKIWFMYGKKNGFP